MSEHDEQVALFNWAKIMESRHPQLKWMFAIPNQCDSGYRAMRRGQKMKAEGVKPGVHDIFLPVVRYLNYDKIPGLWIEMKYNKNKLTKDQEQFKSDMDAEGYQTVTCWTFEEAKQAIIDYLGIEIKS